MPKQVVVDRWKKIVTDKEKMDQLLVDVFLESYAQPPVEVWLGLDGTDNKIHDRQEHRCKF